MTTKKTTTSGLAEYVLNHREQAHRDLAITFMRSKFSGLKTQTDAAMADGYLKGHFVFELKGKGPDWYEGLIEGISRREDLNFRLVGVACNQTLGIWDITSLNKNFVKKCTDRSGEAPSTFAKKMCRQLTAFKDEVWGSAIFKTSAIKSAEIAEEEVERFCETLKAGKPVRSKITTKNFVKSIEALLPFFESPLQAVRAFYTMIYSWNEDSSVLLSEKWRDAANVGSETIRGLIPKGRTEFKRFVESHFISLGNDESTDDFFAQFDKCLDAADPSFRKENGVFFTDLDLSKFAMWFVKQYVPNLGKNYLVVDPACGSGNLVTNWKSPLELRHKVVSEIEPELLYAVEQRMKGDRWHTGKYTVIPKVAENKGLNFLEHTASDYLNILRSYLKAANVKPEKPIAFLCNPPYRGEDIKGGQKVIINDEIVGLTGKESGGERYCSFLAQMKLICREAEDKGLPGNSMLLLFTKSAWLTQRPDYQKIRTEIFGSFEDLGGFIVPSLEFFDVKGQFPVAFTIWKYVGKEKQLNAARPIKLYDLSWITKNDLSTIEWSKPSSLEVACKDVLKSKKTKIFELGKVQTSIKDWSGPNRQNFYRKKTKEENERANFQSGLPKGDSRHVRLEPLGFRDGDKVAFADNLTPFRVKKIKENIPWFRLDRPFMDVRKSRLLSGPPDQKAYCHDDPKIQTRLFGWYSLNRTLASEGYPLWVDNEELWAPNIPTKYQSIFNTHALAIALIENECLEVKFPADNPYKGAIEAWSTNPLSLANPDAYFTKYLKGSIKKSDSILAAKAVKLVDDLYKSWGKNFKKKPELPVDYHRDYFVGDDLVLTRDAGILQIRHYAEELGDQSLKDQFTEIQSVLAGLKSSFYSLLVEDVRYFHGGKPSQQQIVDAAKAGIKVGQKKATKKKTG